MESKNQIVVSCKPFSFLQDVYIFTKEGIRMNVEVTISELPKKIVKIAKKYNINNIDLVGSESFLSKIKDDIVSNKFDNQTLNVTINNI